MRNPVVKVIFSLLVLTSCIVQSPKYTSLEQVMSLRLGMTQAQVEETLGLQPYDLKAFTDTSNAYIYVYRLVDRKTLSGLTKKLNGKRVLGKYVQLTVTYSKQDKVVSITSCTECPNSLVTKSKIDIEKITAFITVTLPALLIYFGLKDQ
jgi:outer membrane protein assembly factor BamE (lipoprotein component of BamABCDE complex)